MKPVIFVVRNNDHFFPVYMDHSSRTVHVLGRTALDNPTDDWVSWDGPRIYNHVCYLHGWSIENISCVSVVSIPWPLNGYDCGPIAIAVAHYLLRNGFNVEEVKAVALSCHHITRLQTLQSLKHRLRCSIQDYVYFRANPPQEWLSLSLQEILPDFDPLDNATLNLERYLHSRNNSVIQNLSVAVSGCRRCISRSSKRDTAPFTPESSPRPRSNEPEDLNNEEDCEIQMEENSLDIPADDSRTRRLHMVKVNWRETGIDRKRRISIPCDLPLPRKPLWAAHDPFFDEYFGGPTRQDLQAFEDPVYLLPMYHPTAGLTIKSCWTYFRDYGYRILSRFAHSFYSCPPMQLDEHIMPIVTNHSIENSLNYFSNMHERPRKIGRTGIPDLRTVVSSDVIVMGMEGMLRDVRGLGHPQSYDHNLLLSYFVKGKHFTGDHVCVDLEKDAIDASSFSIVSTVDIDSFVWVTPLAKVGSAVGLMVVPSIKNNSSIRKHNHVYVEILEPPDEEEPEDGPEKSWLERRVPVSNIPHTLFAKITEGNSPVYCYIFFPRMMHSNEYTKRKMTMIPLEVLLLFWDKVVLNALQDVVGHTVLSPFYEYSIEDYLRKQAGRTGKSDRSFYLGHSKQIEPSMFFSLQERMKEILADHSDQQLMNRFKSFFFVFECKGFKLNVISTDGKNVLETLKHSVPQMAWDYVLDRGNGEAHFDIAFTYQPKVKEESENETSGITGLWRLDYLEESFGKGGYRSGTSHPLNTLRGYGAIQAEMTLERSRRTHVGFRSSYNTVYEVTRKKDNDPWFCGDGDAYHLNETFMKACEEKKKQYEGRGSRSYGVRDEYRVSGVAAVEILNNSDKVVSTCFRFSLVYL